MPKTPKRYTDMADILDVFISDDSLIKLERMLDEGGAGQLQNEIIKILAKRHPKLYINIEEDLAKRGIRRAKH